MSDHEPSSANLPTKPKKIRPTYSCVSCHKRKVKCDRVQPCSACCLRGAASDCEYVTTKQNRRYILQSARIEGLVRKCDDLKRQLAEARQLAKLPPTDDGNEDDTPSPTAESTDTENETSLTSSASQKPVAVDELRNSSPHGRKLLSFVSNPSKHKVLLTDPALASAVIELFVERLIDSFCPRGVPGSIALREASPRRVFSPLLCKAFEAASLTFGGRTERNRQIELAGHMRYIRMLGMLQKSLYGEGRDSTDVLVAILLSTIIEAFRKTSKDSLLKHQLGGLALLRARSPYRHRHGIERSLFVDLRLYWVTAALSHRKPTFLATQEWLTIPWTVHTSKDILHRLLDIAVHIPGYLSQVDDLSSLFRNHDPETTSSGELLIRQSTLQDRLTKLHAQLQMWKTLHADKYHPGAPCEEIPKPGPSPPPPQSNPDNHNKSLEFPIFTSRNPSTMQLTTQPPLLYPQHDTLLPTSLCLYWSLQLILSSAADTIGLTTATISARERYTYACNICRSMKFYIAEIQGCLVSRIMFALGVAFEMFAEGTVEREFVGKVFGVISKRFGLGVQKYGRS